MPRTVEIIERKTIFKKFIFVIEEATLRHELFDGTLSAPMTRLNLERGDAIAAILHDPASDEILLVEQFRFPTFDKSGGWVVETAAGMIDTGETPADAAHREIEEETGYRLTALKPIQTFYLTPGGSSERIHLFYGAIERANRFGTGGGLLSEGENIREVVLPLIEAFTRLDAGGFDDAKTIIALQWMRLGKHRA
ncbi:MAG: NUDIX domain-containing protein [Chloroflexota bacterium]|nr:NUDIX domain-containing protein [Chloroflexota bacterium]